MAKLSNLELKAICEAEMQNATGWSGGELSRERATAMEYYLGEPYEDDGYLEPGRSKLVTREVLQAVEYMMPSLMRIFADADNLVEFDPVGPEDEEAAQQESDFASHVFWKQNRGFYNCYTFAKDALLSKTGVLKVWWDDTEREEREEYHGLDYMELAQLLEEEGIEREIIEFEDTDEGVDITMIAKSTEGRVRIEPWPAEEFGVSRSARSPYAKDSTFVWCRALKSRSQLIEEGHDRDLVSKIPSNDAVDTEEQLARRHLDEEDDFGSSFTHESMDQVWVSECYLRIDRDGDGIAEIVKVTLAAGGSGHTAGSVMLDVEEVDRIPFATVSPVILTHKFNGLSIADLVLDIQRIQTDITRGVIDNMRFQINQRTAINELVNEDDILTSRPGGIVRTEGQTPPGSHIFPIPAPAVPDSIYTLKESLNEEMRDRTGTGGESGALDPTALANVNTGVAAIAADAARAKIELVAQIFAEIGFRPLFGDIHELLSKHSRRKQAVRLRGKWVDVSPGEWRRRENMTIQIGLGVAGKARRVMAHERVMSIHQAAMQAQMPIFLPHQVYANAHDYIEEMGLNPERYFTDPREMPPAPPKEDPQEKVLMLTAQVEREKSQVASQRNQVEFAKVQSNERMRLAELQSKGQEVQLKAAIERARAELGELRSRRDESEKVIRLEIEQEIKAREFALKSMELQQKNTMEAANLALERYQTDRKSLTDIQTTLLEMQGRADQIAQAAATADSKAIAGSGEHAAMIQELREALATANAEMARLKAPKEIKRDADGLIVTVGEMTVERDPDGRVIRVG